MPDRLYLSCWVRGFSETSMLKHFETLLGLFPYSKLASRGPVMRVRAIEAAEPPLIEREFALAASVAEIGKAAREFAHEDCSVEADLFWDLWQFDGDWKLTPTPAGVLSFGPDFENETGDHLRIEFGLDSRFLPIEGVEGSIRMGQSNLRSLLHLITEIEQALPIAKRQLWSESGINFAELLADTVSRLEIN